MQNPATVHVLLSQLAWTLIAPHLRGGDIDPDCMLVVALDCCPAVERALDSGVSCSIQVMPRRQAYRDYGSLLTQAQIVTLSSKPRRGEVRVLVSRGSDVALGALRTWPEGTSSPSV